ncbi:MAG: choice-of-anchor J domain-containing protein [Prevotella sp.]|nr:choice-of-anchor J domain-containing protein [Prevotella sp.]
MKKIYVTLILALVCTMASFAQGLPLQGKTLPYDGIQKKVWKSNILKATMLAGETLITPPETATIETDWVLTGGYINNGSSYSNGNAISVAFDGDEVWIQGLSFLCPAGWIKGIIADGVATFANGQYVGDYGENQIYACGSSDGQTLDDIIFQYDEENKKFTLTNFYLENTSTTAISLYFYSYDIVISKDISIPSPANVEAEPSTTTADITWTETGEATQWNLRYREFFNGTKHNRFWDFEDTDQLADWIVIDNDEDGNTWQYANSRYTTNSGSGVLISASYDNDNSAALTPDNWLITPEVPLGGKVSFYACGQDASYAAEVFAVYVCQGGDDSLDEITAVSDDITATGTMTKYEIDLSGFEGSGRIAIRHYNCTDMFYLNIDDVKVEIPNGVDQPDWTVVEGLTDTQYTIEGLSPETDYEVQVKAVADISSAWTESTIFTTLALAEDITVTVPAAATDGEFNYATLFYSDKNLVIPEGIGAYTATVANGNVTLEEVKEIISAGTAVVLKTASKLSETTDFSFAVTNETGASAENNMLRGSDEDATINAEGYKYYMLSLNGASEENSIGFYWDKNSNSGTQLNTKAHKAYLAVPQDAAQAKGYPFGGDATGVNGVSVSADEKAGEVFDLQGRRVARPVKGIYIVNGKKIVIK